MKKLTRLGFIVHFTLILLIFLSTNCGSYIKETTLAENVSVSSEWKYIETLHLIKFEKDYHYISILLSPPNKAHDKQINPDIKLFDSKGKEYKLEFVGTQSGESGEYVKYGYKSLKNSMPTNVSYEKLSIKNNSQIKLRKILWSGYNAEDLK